MGSGDSSLEEVENGADLHEQRLGVSWGGWEAGGQAWVVIQDHTGIPMDSCRSGTRACYAVWNRPPSESCHEPTCRTCGTLSGRRHVWPALGNRSPSQPLLGACERSYGSPTATCAKQTGRLWGGVERKAWESRHDSASDRGLWVCAASAGHACGAVGKVLGIARAHHSTCACRYTAAQ